MLILDQNRMMDLDLRMEEPENLLKQLEIQSSQEILGDNLQWFMMPFLDVLVHLLVFTLTQTRDI